MKQKFKSDNFSALSDDELAQLKEDALEEIVFINNSHREREVQLNKLIKKIDTECSHREQEKQNALAKKYLDHLLPLKGKIVTLDHSDNQDDTYMLLRDISVDTGTYPEVRLSCDTVRLGSYKWKAIDNGNDVVKETNTVSYENFNVITYYNENVIMSIREVPITEFINAVSAKSIFMNNIVNAWKDGNSLPAVMAEKQ